MTSRIFRVDATSNKVDELPPTKFADGGFLETKNIHEWLADHSGLLGEDLLVIQREHVGVQGSRRRPDILAIDTEGNLVVVEAKRDDSGFDVYWQAAMYAAAYWPRKGVELVDLYADYAEVEKDEAVRQLVEHTGSEDEQDLLSKLNTRQRLILVARSFPKEVTSTALWLIEQGVDVSCLQLTPYFDAATKTYYIHRTYLIPIPDTKDLMVRLRDVKQERAVQEASASDRAKDEISDFMANVRERLLESIPGDVRPTKWSRWAGIWGTTRYYKFWYDEHPWRNGSLCFSAELETGKDKPRKDQVFVSFYVYLTYLRSLGVSEEIVTSLKQRANELHGTNGFQFTQHEASFYVGKWVSTTGLTSTDAEAVAHTLADIITRLAPKVRRILQPLATNAEAVVISDA